jgi:hypothetical protein
VELRSGTGGNIFIAFLAKRVYAKPTLSQRFPIYNLKYTISMTLGMEHIDEAFYLQGRSASPRDERAL